MKLKTPITYRLGRELLRTVLGFYFSRIDRFHLEYVPMDGPVLFASNHPNSVTDAFVIGASVPRKVNFVATVQLFHIRPVRWLLTNCGVIPINRVTDDPRAMRTVMDTFEACFRVLERGEAIGIFPEGITHDDPQLKKVKTGSARMALELEHRHAGNLGLRIVPVGLTFSAKEIYRSRLLVNFGKPIRVTDFLAGYDQNRHGAIQRLNVELERRLQALILHLPNLERARIVDAVKRLYLDRLWVGNTVIHEPVEHETGELLLTQAIAAAAECAFAKHPDRANDFVRKLDHYEWVLRKLHLSDAVLAHFPDRKKLVTQSLGWTAVAVLGAPLALYGWAHRLIPCAIVQSVVRRTARPTDKTQVSTATVLSGSMVFTLFYAACAAVFYSFFGWPAVIWYALSLPVSSLLAHYYLRELRRFAASLRAVVVLLRTPIAARRLLALRRELIAMIDAERHQARAGAEEVGRSTAGDGNAPNLPAPL